MNSKQAALQLKVEGSRRGERGQKNSQHLTHTWIEKMIQKPQYITQKGRQGKKDEEKEEKRKKSERLKKNNSKKREFHIIDHTIRAYPKVLFVSVYE